MAKPAIPKYVQLKRELMKRIRGAKPGECLESEHELVRRLSISRATVAKAIGELVTEGYLYREQGRGTFVARTTSAPDGPIGVIFSGASTALRPGSYYGDIFGGIQEAVHAAGRDLLCMAGKVAPKEDFRPPTPAALAQRGLAGVIVVGVDSDDHLAEVLSAGLPTVSVDYHTDRLEIDSVVGDAEAGGCMATAALIASGHRRIAFLGHARHGSRTYMAPDQGSLDRLAGYRRAHREAGLAVDEEMVFQPRQTEVQLDVQMDKLTAAGRTPTAAFSTGSPLLDQLLGWAARRGRPMEWISAGWPAVQQGLPPNGGFVWEEPAEMGRAAARLVLERIAGGGGAPRDVRIPAKMQPAPRNANTPAQA